MAADAPASSGLSNAATRSMRPDFSRLIPRPHRNLFCWSLISTVYALALLEVVVLAAGSSGLALPAPRDPAGRLLLDVAVLVVSGWSVLYSIYLCWVYLGCDAEATVPRETGIRVRNALTAVVFVGLFIAFQVVVERFLFKPSFSLDRPFAAHTLPLTPFVSSWIGFEHMDGTAAPCGFVLGQTMLLMYSWLLADQSDWLARKNFLTHKAFVGASTLLCLIFVSVARVVTGAHYSFDVVIAIALGEFLFWWVVLVAGLVIRGGEREIRWAKRLAFPGLFFSILLLQVAANMQRAALFVLLWMFIWGLALDVRARVND
jgi:hypothetical protein